MRGGKGVGRLAASGAEAPPRRATFNVELIKMV